MWKLGEKCHQTRLKGDILRILKNNTLFFIDLNIFFLFTFYIYRIGLFYYGQNLTIIVSHVSIMTLTSFPAHG